MISFGAIQHRINAEPTPMHHVTGNGINPTAMRLPVIAGTIDRRILINFRADPTVVEKLLPQPFKPKLYLGHALVGICLIRLKGVRVKGFPEMLGISSENAAHRIAVTWTESGKERGGVYIPRRDTSSLINSIAGGRVFPGRHYHSTFEILEANNSYSLIMTNPDGTELRVKANICEGLNSQSIFENLESVSKFFQEDSVGYSPSNGHFDGIRLEVKNWIVQPLIIEFLSSSYFHDLNKFPKGSIEFDNALLMENIEHEWHSEEDICHCL